MRSWQSNLELLRQMADPDGPYTDFTNQRTQAQIIALVDTLIRHDDVGAATVVSREAEGAHRLDVVRRGTLVIGACSCGRWDATGPSDTVLDRFDAHRAEAHVATTEASAQGQHRPSYRKTPEGFVADCTCSWLSAARSTSDLADEDWRNHVHNALAGERSRAATIGAASGYVPGEPKSHRSADGAVTTIRPLELTATGAASGEATEPDLRELAGELHVTVGSSRWQMVATRLLSALVERAGGSD